MPRVASELHVATIKIIYTKVYPQGSEDEFAGVYVFCCCFDLCFLKRDFYESRSDQYHDQGLASDVASQGVCFEKTYEYIGQYQ
jgi:hypothetical protein